MVPRRWVYWFAPPGTPPAPHSTFGSEFYDNSPEGQQLVQGSSVPGTRTRWLDGSYRAAASECQGPWLSGRARYWSEGACPDHTGAYPDVFLARFKGINALVFPNHVQATEWFKMRRGPDANSWTGRAWAHGDGGSQEVTFQFVCPGGISLGCSYALAGFGAVNSGSPDPALTFFHEPTWAAPLSGAGEYGFGTVPFVSLSFEYNFNPVGHGSG